MFPVFRAHAQPAILRIWQETHAQMRKSASMRLEQEDQFCIHMPIYSAIIYAATGISFIWG